MKPRIAGLFPVVLMLGLAALTFWLERLVQLPPPVARDTLRHDPDFKVFNFTVTRMDKAGFPQSTLSAASMLHFPDDETTELDQPRFVQMAPDKPPIRVVSRRGTVTKDGEEVHLMDDVIVIREGEGGRPQLRVDTVYLSVRPNDETATTPEHVLITEGAARLQGVGMHLNGRTRELTLHSQVRGMYPPSARAER